MPAPLAEASEMPHDSRALTSGELRRKERAADEGGVALLTHRYGENRQEDPEVTSSMRDTTDRAARSRGEERGPENLGAIAISMIDV